MKITKSERADDTACLCELLQDVDVIYTDLKHVSRSGMSRSIALYVIKDNKPIWLSYYAARVLGWGWDDKRYAVKVKGCGMDMGFHVVYALSSTLFKDGYKLNQKWL